MSEEVRPLPMRDEQSAPYWEAAADHVLTLAQCSECGLFTMPPDVVCPHCRSVDPRFHFAPVSGRGVIRAWTVMRESFLPGFQADVPFVLVDVEIDEQRDLRLIGRLVDGVDAALHLGARVRPAFEDVAPGVAVPAFALEEPQ